MHALDQTTDLRNGDGIHFLESMGGMRSSGPDLTSAPRQLPPEDLQRLQNAHRDMLEAAQTLQLIAQIRDLKTERYQLLLQYLAQREGIDLSCQEIRFSDGAIVPLTQGR